MNGRRYVLLDFLTPVKMNVIVGPIIAGGMKFIIILVNDLFVLSILCVVILRNSWLSVGCDFILPLNLFVYQVSSVTIPSGVL